MSLDSTFRATVIQKKRKKLKNGFVKLNKKRKKELEEFSKRIESLDQEIVEENTIQDKRITSVHIPEDVWIEILKFLDVEVIFGLICYVSKDVYKATKNDILFLNLLIAMKKLPKNDSSYKSQYLKAFKTKPNDGLKRWKEQLTINLDNIDDPSPHFLKISEDIAIRSKKTWRISTGLQRVLIGVVNTELINSIDQSKRKDQNSIIETLSKEGYWFNPKSFNILHASRKQKFHWDSFFRNTNRNIDVPITQVIVNLIPQKKQKKSSQKPLYNLQFILPEKNIPQIKTCSETTNSNPIISEYEEEKNGHFFAFRGISAPLSFVVLFLDDLGKLTKKDYASVKMLKKQQIVKEVIFSYLLDEPFYEGIRSGAVR